jgi:peptidylprolyl isomerase
MANSGKNTNSSQFFFSLAPLPKLDGKHVAFGKVIEGLDVLKQINEVAASADGTPKAVVYIANCGESK